MKRICLQASDPELESTIIRIGTEIEDPGLFAKLIS